MFNVGMKKTYLHIKPYTLTNESPRFDSMGVLVRLMATAEQTGGAFNLFDILAPAGYETPLHIHYAEDVAVQVLEGSLEIYWGEEKRQAQVGSFFFQPRGTPHGFRVTGTLQARVLYQTFPAGFDGYVLERSRPLTEAGASLLAARYKIEVLGPLPPIDPVL